MTDTKNLKPFDLEKALAGAPVVRRNGEKVLRIFKCEEMDCDDNIIAVTKNAVKKHYASGKHFTDSGESIFDLFMLPTKKKLWIYVATEESDDGVHYCSCAYADKNKISQPRYQLIEIEIDV